MLLGLDLSLTASAAVAVSPDWDGDFCRVQTFVVGEKLHRDSSDAARAMRTDMIASRILAFARTVGATSAWVEGYAYSQNVAAHSLAELGGVVRLALVRAGIELRTVTASSARKLLLGKLPQGKQKQAVQEALKAAGAPASWSPDEFDAFTVANWGLSEVGGYCFVQEQKTLIEETRDGSLLPEFQIATSLQ